MLQFGALKNVSLHPRLRQQFDRKRGTKNLTFYEWENIIKSSPADGGPTKT